MKPATIDKLVQLNHQFYQTFALQFSASRQRLQPGVRRVLEQGFPSYPKTLPPDANILELGCGNGMLARELARRGHRGSYIGLDSNVRLLEEAQNNLPDAFKGSFLHVDLASMDWDQSLPATAADVILAFAVLHHVPAEELRKQVLHKARQLLHPDGSFIHSEWQFLNNPRLRKRIQPWELAGLSPAELEPGDYLLDWRRGGHGLRYVHHFSETELEALAENTGFMIVETFYSDGEGGKLGLYQLWKPSNSAETPGIEYVV